MSKRAIEIETRAGRASIAVGAVAGDFATHRCVRVVGGKTEASGRRWCVTHIPTGRAVLDDLVSAAHAGAVSAELARAAGLSAALSALVSDPRDGAARRVVSAALSGLRDRTLEAVTRPS